MRSYYRARSRVPAVLGSLWGAGVYGLSAPGRRRFDTFPDLVGDDLWVDGRFDSGEVEIVDCLPVVVVAPRRSRDLVRVLRRAYFGKGERASAPDPDGRGPRPSDPPFTTSAGYLRLVPLRRSTPRSTPRSPPARGSWWRSGRLGVTVGVGTTARGPAEMSGPSPDLGATAHANRASTRSHAVVMLQVFALALMVIPSDTVIAPIGAAGYPAALVGMLMFGVLVAARLFGLHDPLEQGNPIRTVLCVLWLAILGSYVLMDRSEFSVTEAASADRLLLELAVITGVALMAAEHLSSLSDIRRVLIALCWGGAFCGVVAAMQFWISLDVAPYLRQLPGFSLNFDNPGIALREGMNRVSGTSVYPIELGVVAGMLLPLAIYLAMYDTDRSAGRRWAPVALIALAIPASVSRSAIVSVALGSGCWWC